MSNTVLTPSMITKESLRVLVNSLAFTNGATKKYDDRFAQRGAKIGDTLSLRKPPRYIGRTGATLAIEDSVETSVPLVLNTQFGVDIQFSSKDLTLSVDEFSARFIKPAMATIANKIDRDGLALYKNVYNTVGTMGTTPATTKVFLDAGVKMDFEAAPNDGDRSVIIDPNAMGSMVDAVKGLFNPQSNIGDYLRRGMIAKDFLRLDWAMDQNVNVHTVGALGGTPLVNGAGQTGSSLNTKGWTASITALLNVGDVFTIAGVNAVNPQTRQTTGQLRQFVVTAVANSDGSGNSTVSISPAITTSGQFQTVTASPGDGAAITVVGTGGQTSPANLAYHKDAFVVAFADLEVPNGVDMAARASDEQTGISIRMIRNFDIRTDQWPCRLDVLYGWAVQYPELACRIQG